LPNAKNKKNPATQGAVNGINAQLINPVMVYNHINGMSFLEEFIVIL
jgi:hypothetical protein